jgi:hypothetical protein
VTKSKGVFDKGYQPAGSIEIFKIAKLVNRTPVVYRLVDLNDEEIVGTFYEQELIKTKKPSASDLYFIDKILKRRRGPGGVKEIFVSYLGWPASFNAWIKESDIVDQEAEEQQNKNQQKSNTIKKKRRKWKRHY